MRAIKLFLIMGVAVIAMSAASAQSKKQMIEILTLKADSLQKALSAKSESFHQLEIKQARLEGATEAHNEVIKRLESKADSLTALLMSKDTTIQSLTTKISALRNVVDVLKAQEKEWSTQNEVLQTELAAFKQKGGVPEAIAKDAAVPAASSRPSGAKVPGSKTASPTVNKVAEAGGEPLQATAKE
ncbi:hypothetical protein BDE36_3055 [Arcticibacter tournemirensis]|uniref:Uncharacterized protein n=1 Tax=Arcticibacter tournemirensis TaxID=699437 RepID=A0A5M9GQY9_9SPHI|nr:hypothetical protein [Arcticibacter tournemirensis]KAA8476117.1 hypothetical protein F1649_20600 [Arcticibacter tournemirensis]TQM51279.1 hypothetical protein BDE36_3055 [Arcticibacter tournemirensis]